MTAEGSILPRSITVRADASNRSFILVHEIGHLIDAVGLPGVGFTTASLTATDLDGWREAAALSMAVRDLEKLERRAEVALRDRANYLGQAAEIWARSYAQFVTIRSGSDILRASLDVLRRRSTSDVYFPRQWDNEDFGPIDTAIANLFGRLGWIE